MASFDEQRKGTLARDLLAERDRPVSGHLPAGHRVIDAVVDTTIFDGRIVYTRPPSPANTQ